MPLPKKATDMVVDTLSTFLTKEQLVHILDNIEKGPEHFTESMRTTFGNLRRSIEDLKE